MIRRRPLRTRLLFGTLVVSTALVILASLGIYAYLGAQLDRSVGKQLDTRLADLRSTTRQLTLERAIGIVNSQSGAPDANNLTQLLDERGHVLATSDPKRARSVLDRSFLTELRDDVPRTARIAVFEEGGQVTAARARSRDDIPLIAVVATSREPRKDLLEGLSTGLFVGGPLLVMLIVLTALHQIGASLRAVDDIQQQAERISAASGLGARVPVPVARDEIHRLATTLNAMLQRLQHAVEQQRDFVATASHQLRTPLTIIRGEAEYALGAILDHEAADAETVEVPVERLVAMMTEADRLSLLIDGLLLLAEQEQHGVKLQRALVRFGPLLRHVADRFGGRAEQLQRRIEVEAPSTSIDAYMDSLLVEQAVANLVDNSLRYGQGQVTIRLSADNTWATVVVIDEGPGIPAELRHAAFDRFVGGGGGGSGLGLSIVRSITEAHGGTVELIAPRSFVALQFPRAQEAD